MDIDIGDILASVSAPSIPQHTLDLQALTRAWVNERTSPELLPYPKDVVERTTGRVKKQIETIEELTGTMDPKSNFTLVVLQTELERYRFLLRSFLRARISKVDKYPLHTRTLSLSDPHLLSNLEAQYLQSHHALLSAHFHSSFLSAFPASLQRLDDTAGGISMVDRPDEETAVFCRILRDSGDVEVHGDVGTTAVELHRGDIWVLRWGAVKEKVVTGDIELI